VIEMGIDDLALDQLQGKSCKSETIVEDPVTGGKKGRKPEVASLIPLDSVLEIGTVYEYGSRKYSSHNWRRGYPWSWSFDALVRHLFAWWSGEDKDPESGLSHLAHAGFHVLSLMWYQRNGRGTDDRWKEGS